MDLKNKNNNLDKLSNKELVELLEFYLNIVNKSFLDAEGCKRCSESCCDIFNNNFKKMKNILNNITNEIQNENSNIEKKSTIMKDRVDDSNISKNFNKDYLASVEFNNLEKKYK